MSECFFRQFPRLIEGRRCLGAYFHLLQIVEGPAELIRNIGGRLLVEVLDCPARAAGSGQAVPLEVPQCLSLARSLRDHVRNCLQAVPYDVHDLAGHGGASLTDRDCG